MKHLGPLALFAALAVAWTWPLVPQLGSAIPGGPGDNYSFLWNLWWMRHVLATPGLDYFHTTDLFYPFGTTIVDHPHTALPALVAATLLRPLSPAAAQNVLLLAYVFLNMACAYALVWDVLSDKAASGGLREVGAVHRGSILGAIIFGLSPYLASHLLGHFDLIAAFFLPLFALAVRRAVISGSSRWAAGAGIILVATAYTAYYYVVYLAFFLAVYLIASVGWTPVRWSTRTQTGETRRIRIAIIGLSVVLASTAVWVLATGGRVLTLGPGVISIRTPQNALTGIWICAMAYALCLWRPRLTRAPVPIEPARRTISVGAWITVVFLAGAAPLLWEATQLVVHHEYVTPSYQWRSAPRGVDLIAPLLGPPLHPLAPAVERLYTTLRLDRIESVGWVGLAPLLLVAAGLFEHRRATGEVRLWRIVAAAFAIWALGPILTIGGFDTGLKLPATLLRYVPFVANARMPGRAMVGVFLALAVLAGVALAHGSGRWHRPGIQWLLIAFVGFEFWDSPIPLTVLDRPAVYEVLAAAPPGAVCEVPFGIGDGLTVGVGSQERAALYYATIHGHPLVGGYIGRMPADAAQRYERMPIVGALLRLSDGRPAGADAGDGPCRYFVVNRTATPAALRSYMQQLPLTRLAGDEARDLYQVGASTRP